jgi:cytochrome b561
MLKRFGIVLVFLAFSRLLVAQSSPSTPSVDGILARFHQTLGGRTALARIRAMVFTGTMSISGSGKQATTTEYFQSPHHFAAIVEMPGYLRWERV